MTSCSPRQHTSIIYFSGTEPWKKVKGGTYAVKALSLSQCSSIANQERILENAWLKCIPALSMGKGYPLRKLMSRQTPKIALQFSDGNKVTATRLDVQASKETIELFQTPITNPQVQRSMCRDFYASWSMLSTNGRMQTVYATPFDGNKVTATRLDAWEHVEIHVSSRTENKNELSRLMHEWTSKCTLSPPMGTNSRLRRTMCRQPSKSIVSCSIGTKWRRRRSMRRQTPKLMLQLQMAAKQQRQQWMFEPLSKRQ